MNVLERNPAGIQYVSHSERGHLNGHSMYVLTGWVLQHSSEPDCWIMLCVWQDKWGEQYVKDFFFWEMEGTGIEERIRDTDFKFHYGKNNTVFKKAKSSMLCIILFMVAAVARSPPTGMATRRVYSDYRDQIPLHHSTVQVKIVLIVSIFSRNIKHFIRECINSFFLTTIYKQ